MIYNNISNYMSIKPKRKLTNTQREINLYYLKKIYSEAFFWHLIHKGYYLEKSELEYIIQMKN